MTQSDPSASTVRATVTSSAALGNLTCGGININLYPGTEVEGGPTQIYLRRHTQDGITSTPLLGPAAPGGVRAGTAGGDQPDAGVQFIVDGRWGEVAYSVALVSGGQATWYWQVALRNDGESASFDLILTQDIALSPYGMIRNNEYYVCQYLDNTALEHPEKGYAVAVRNNLGVAKRIPWAALGSLGRAVGYTTDALVFHNLALRNGTPSPGLVSGTLPSERFQHEHNLIAIQDELIDLDRGDAAQRGFFGIVLADHPLATSTEDLAHISTALNQPGSRSGLPLGHAADAGVSTLFAPAVTFDAIDLGPAAVAEIWGDDRRHEERDNDTLEAFFTGAGGHVVLRNKERRVLRPHGHMLRTGDNLVPDEAQLTNTTYMNGFFATQLAQGHVGVNKITTTARSYLGLQKSGGLRIFVEIDGAWQLLDQPSAYEITPNSARWIYDSGDTRIDLLETAGTTDPVISLAASTTTPTRFLLSIQVATSGDESGEVAADFTADGGGVTINAPAGSGLGSFRFDLDAPFAAAGDSPLFSDGVSRGAPFVTLTTEEVADWVLTMTGRLIPQADLDAARKGILRIEPAATEAQYVGALLNGLDMASASDPDISRLGTTMPWYVQNALVHYLSPRGLEQYNGGGWGTRDISQGPVELLLGLDHHQPIKELLKLVFVAQNAHGGWPQAFGFFDRNMFRHADDDPHGDVVFWPPLALAEYVKASGDVAFLDDEIAYYVKDGQPQSGSVLDHVARAIGYINDRLIPGTRLESYGHGDWNDSLQPADHSMTDTLVSSWTVTLHYQMLRALAGAFELAGRGELAQDYSTQADAVLADFQKWLVVDGVLAGYASFKDPEHVTYLVHPVDDRTPLTYSILPIIHALINDMLTPQQAIDHKAILERYLVAPDGGRLFDSPPKYQGGPQVFFQRAESSTFFGREIGIMYTHAHLRYAESMARYGDADAFLLALRQAIPLGFTQAVSNGRVRQSNCYFSSSDATFTDRYQASAEYARVLDGTIDVEGGWRVYSSGAGISVRLILECLLGIRRGRETTVIDPVMPSRLNGTTVGLNIAGRPVTIEYRVGPNGCGVTSVDLNGTKLPTTPLANAYRTPGVAVATSTIAEGLTGHDDRLVVTLA